MSSVTNVWVQPERPNVVQPNSGVKSSGSSSCPFTFVGVYVDPGADQVVVVLQAARDRNSGARINETGDGAIFPAASPGDDAGAFCCLFVNTIKAPDPNNWTVRARTDKDQKGTGYTFVGGTGGGGRRHEV